MRAILLATLPLIILASACKKEEPAPQPTESSADPLEAKPGLTVSEGSLLLPPVSGRPAAAYFTFANNGAEPVTLAAVSIQGAGKAEMHETTGGKMAPVSAIEVKPGETIRFERGGKHVMAFDLAPTIAAGGTAELTLTFADGDKLSAPLRVESIVASPAQSPAGAEPQAQEGREPAGRGGEGDHMDMGHGEPH